jgi:hypothetical protein
MNRAAEDASCLTAAPIFVNAIKQMTITDGLTILRGDESAATAFLTVKDNSRELKIQPLIPSSNHR